VTTKDDETVGMSSAVAGPTGCAEDPCSATVAVSDDDTGGGGGVGVDNFWVGGGDFGVAVGDFTVEGGVGESEVAVGDFRVEGGVGESGVAVGAVKDFGVSGGGVSGGYFAIVLVSDLRDVSEGAFKSS